MKHLTILLALSLPACDPATHVNSASAAHACQVAISAGSTAQDIAAFFIAHGWEVAKAQKVANAISALQIPVATGCALLAPA